MAQPATSKPATTFRGACLTIFGNEGYSELPDGLSYFAYGVETCPTTGRIHLQAFAYSKNAMRLTGWKKIFPTAHIEPMRGNFQENEVYCSKEGKLVEFGQKPMKNGHRRDLTDLCEAIVSGTPLDKVIVKDYAVTFVQYHNGLTKLANLFSTPYEHETVRGFWLWGVPGAGKSHYARTRFSKPYIKAQNKWFDGYQGEKTILLDDYDCGRMLGHYLKIWFDKWSCTGEVKGGTVHLQHHEFVVTSNYSIEEMFPDDFVLQQAIRRRCEVIHFGVVYKA